MTDIHSELLKLNLGCGLNAPCGWVNIDASFTERLSKYKGLYNVLCKICRVKPVPWPKNIKTIDVRYGLPFSDGSAEIIFISHMLEHMDFEKGNFVIGECYRCLCKGGVIRIIVPDLYQMTKRYVDLMAVDPKADHSHNLLRDLNMQAESHKGIVDVFYKLVTKSKHLYMYDEYSLRELLEKHGFNRIQRMDYGHSLIPDVTLVEDKAHHQMAVCLEGIK
jgi:predicted SAM-dependent methyltransferase